jgi:PhzF family phenazine biosynthesis protein
MNLSIFQADAFADELFRGNPAAVVPLKEWLPDKLMQNIAMENNLSETAFFIPGDECFHMRWFTPTTEVSLCGHATLAAAHILFNHLNFSEETIRFKTKSGLLTVSRHDGLLFLDFPVAHLKSIPTPKGLTAGLGLRPLEVWHSGEYLMAVYKNESEIRQIVPDFSFLLKLPYLGINVTARGDSADIVSRFFAPSVGINEDPVTGSAHTLLIPFWHQRLGKTSFISHQISKRGGMLYCEYLEERVKIGGKAVTFMVGSIQV